MVKLEVTIDDSKWPKLTIVAVSQLASGPKTTKLDWLYDTSYSQFENTLHNHLRPMVEEVVKRRLNPALTAQK